MMGPNWQPRLAIKKKLSTADFKMANERGKKSQQHQEFPSGLPSKYYPGPTLLDFSDRTRTGMFNMVWPLAKYSIKIGTHKQQISETKQLKFLKCVKSDATPAVRLLICT